MNTPRLPVLLISMCLLHSLTTAELVTDCESNSCIRFCCEPGKETPRLQQTQDCLPLKPNEIRQYDPYVNLLLANGTRVRRNATKDFPYVVGTICDLSAMLALIPQMNAALSWDLLENGSIASPENGLFTKDEYCLRLTDVEEGRYVWNPSLCLELVKTPWVQLIPYVSMAISVPFIVVTLLVYIFLPELQNLHGKCFMCYLACLGMSCLMLSTINLSKTGFILSRWCQYLGYFLYFCLVGVFFWLNVISYDLWQSFRRTAPVRGAPNRRFLYYSLYGWGLPLGLTIVLIICNKSNLDMAYHPGIGMGSCFLKYSDWSALYYYVGINLFIVLVDTILFSLTLYKIMSMKKDIKNVMNKGDSKRSNQMKEDRTNFGLFLRLFLIMGVTWIFDALGYILSTGIPGFQHWFFLATDALNAFVGPLIFICFVLNRKVLDLLKKRIKIFRGDSVDSTAEEETVLSTTSQVRSGQF